jgi:hypothetical protein
VDKLVLTGIPLRERDILPLNHTSSPTWQESNLRVPREDNHQLSTHSPYHDWIIEQTADKELPKVLYHLSDRPACGPGKI